MSVRTQLVDRIVAEINRIVAQRVELGWRAESTIYLFKTDTLRKTQSEDFRVAVDTYWFGWFYWARVRDEKGRTLHECYLGPWYSEVGRALRRLKRLARQQIAEAKERRLLATTQKALAVIESLPAPPEIGMLALVADTPPDNWAWHVCDLCPWEGFLPNPKTLCPSCRGCQWHLCTGTRSVNSEGNTEFAIQHPSGRTLMMTRVGHPSNNNG